MDPKELYHRCGPVMLQCIQAYLASYRLREIDGSTDKDLLNDVVIKLLENDQRALRTYDPKRGTLEAFCHRFTRSRVIERHRHALRRKAIAPIDALAADVDPLSPGASPEQRVIAAGDGRKVVDCIREHIKSPKGQQMFDDLYLDRRTDDEIEALRGVARSEIHHWRSTIKKYAHGCAAHLFGAAPRSDDDVSEDQARLP